jgi:hypothetical protein
LLTKPENRNSSRFLTALGNKSKAILERGVWRGERVVAVRAENACAGVQAGKEEGGAG